MADKKVIAALEELKAMSSKVLTEEYMPKAIVHGDDDRTPASWQDLEEAVKVLGVKLGELSKLVAARDPAKAVSCAGDIQRLVSTIAYMRPETVAVFSKERDGELGR